MRAVPADRLDYAPLLRPGGRVLVGQGTAEPLTLTRRLVAAPPPYDLPVFLGPMWSDVWSGDVPPALRLECYGAFGAGARLARERRLAIYPMHVSALAATMGSDRMPVDAVLLQLRPALSGKGWNLGLCRDFVARVARQARVVVAELNPHLPACHGGDVGDLPLTALVQGAEPPVTLPPAPISDIDRRVAAHVAALIPDGAVIQLGVGTIPAAVLAALSGHRDLGLHSGAAPEGVADLIQTGVLTNARKERDRGVSVFGMLIGTPRLYALADRNPALRIAGPDETHNPAIIAGLSRFHAINSALEVDLTGQVGSEEVGGRYLGAVGGQADFVRAAPLSSGGRSIIALPSVTPKGASRIVARVGAATCGRADADTFVTEHGVADLRGQSLAERARRMIAIAHPDHREALARHWHDGGLA
ncbi:acetyl-CoA hydrolase/transferase family protein [Gemmobacter sp.]|uniref:acetyl-CoA hydrolase/transferase family protein n=1 Tax=Gemmobacter sp. TaxID=1898957 RepID=UPI002AFF2156|nr:acetyl-CoA hydrolase/transferase C-terminal domain-containing protein [Gemmobacter sp.]